MGTELSALLEVESDVVGAAVSEEVSRRSVKGYRGFEEVIMVVQTVSIQLDP